MLKRFCDMNLLDQVGNIIFFDAAITISAIPFISAIVNPLPIRAVCTRGAIIIPLPTFHGPLWRPCHNHHNRRARVPHGPSDVPFRAPVRQKSSAMIIVVRTPQSTQIYTPYHTRNHPPRAALLDISAGPTGTSVAKNKGVEGTHNNQ